MPSRLSPLVVAAVRADDDDWIGHLLMYFLRRTSIFVSIFVFRFSGIKGVQARGIAPRALCFSLSCYRRNRLFLLCGGGSSRSAQVPPKPGLKRGPPPSRFSTYSGLLSSCSCPVVLAAALASPPPPPLKSSPHLPFPRRTLLRLVLCGQGRKAKRERSCSNTAKVGKSSAQVSGELAGGVAPAWR